MPRVCCKRLVKASALRNDVTLGRRDRFAEVQLGAEVKGVVVYNFSNIS